MQRNPFFFIIIFSLILLLIDFYFYRGIKKLIVNFSKISKRIISFLIWIIPVILIAGLIFFPFIRDQINPSKFLIYFHFISGTFVLFYLPKLIFILFNIVDDLYKVIFKYISKKRENEIEGDGINKITRSQFLTKIGIITAGVPFLSIAYGIGWGRFDFTIRKVKLSFKNLPSKFNGLKIVQLSDFHLGSFLNHLHKVEEAVEIVNDLKPDLLLFTGDMVNNISNEMDKFMPFLSSLNAKIEKYSILGNHDYGDYINWDSEESKSKNLLRLINLQKDAGFKMLKNSSEKIFIDNEFINILGVENWGLPPFPQYGDLQKALVNAEENSFKILLSHDPTHWDEQVLRYTNIDLTLSGHTHGAQFGIEIPGWRWSPVNVRYKRWGGLYSEDNQHLYVNTGIGFIGFPGRVGMPPEITMIELNT